MQHTIFPSLIPGESESDIREELRTVALVLNIETSILLASPKEKRKMKAKDVEELVSLAEQLVDAAMNSTLIDDGTKMTILKKAMIIESNKELPQVAITCVSSARAFLQLGTKTFSKAVRVRQDTIRSYLLTVKSGS
ncbi:unnamed protein product [Arctia plantaginis]|uniref:Uncharacterized protein n=1 Tax=Arctia plantaginis TaxID=874455 RepID=A0A8S0ZAB9_ARCPL|nr:unnamed protein product [Arctia plantaginis]